MSYQKCIRCCSTPSPTRCKTSPPERSNRPWSSWLPHSSKRRNCICPTRKNREKPCCAGLLSILVFQQFPSDAPVGEIALHLRVERRRVVVVPDVGQLVDHHVLDGRRRIGHQVQ